MGRATGKTVGWVIDEPDGPIVKDVFRRTLAGELWSIVRDLEARGGEPPRGSGRAVWVWGYGMGEWGREVPRDVHRGAAHDGADL